MLLRHRLRPLLPAAACAVVAGLAIFAVSDRMPTLYRATATVAVQDALPALPAARLLGFDGKGPWRHVDDARAPWVPGDGAVTRARVAATVATQLGLGAHAVAGAISLYDTESLQLFDEASPFLPLLEFSAASTSRPRAALIATTYARAYLDDRIAIYRRGFAAFDALRPPVAVRRRAQLLQRIEERRLFLARAATVPRERFSPHPGRDALVAVAIGALLGEIGRRVLRRRRGQRPDAVPTPAAT